MAEKTTEVQSVEITKLKEAVAKMKQEASKAANRVESLSKIIIQERQTLQTRMEKVRLRERKRRGKRGWLRFDLEREKKGGRGERGRL